MLFRSAVVFCPQPDHRSVHQVRDVPDPYKFLLFYPVPFIFNGVFGANVSFGGTSIIIIVGVILETVKQIESQLLVRNYKGFLNN